MKYKAGDIVKILDGSDRHHWTDSMKEQIGTIQQIEACGGKDKFWYTTRESHYFWDEDCLELVKSANFDIPYINYTELIHLMIELLDNHKESWDKKYREGVKDCLLILNKLPFVDAVEVIRCEDCRYWNRDEITPEYNGATCQINDCWWEATAFCADGKRRETDNERNS